MQIQPKEGGGGENIFFFPFILNTIFMRLAVQLTYSVWIKFQKVRNMLKQLPWNGAKKLIAESSSVNFTGQKSSL